MESEDLGLTPRIQPKHSDEDHSSSSDLTLNSQVSTSHYCCLAQAHTYYGMIQVKRRSAYI
jgi:hypothetical protein